MNILITGGLGFIGSNLTSYLYKKENIKKIIIIDNFHNSSLDYLKSICKFKYFDKSSKFKKTNDKVVIIKEDVSNYNFALEITKNIDYIVHLAAESGIDVSINKPKKSFDVNVVGTFNYLNAAKVNKVKKFIFSSSGAVFGNLNPPIKVDAIRGPISPYGSSKLSIESYCETYSQVFDISVCILRFSNAYGEYSRHKNSVVAQFIKNILDKNPIIINGNGEHTRDYIFAEDLVGAIYKSIMSRKKLEIFNISTGSQTSINKLLDEMIKKFKEYDISIPRVIKAKNRKGDIKFSSMSNKYARKKLSWNNKISLSKGLNKTIEWFINEKK
tara:strand:+ start:1340 stop:2323 length:984 start_codon:yes stop_codon:yes gene_type:complete